MIISNIHTHNASQPLHCISPLVSIYHVYRFHDFTSMTTHATHSITHCPIFYLYLTNTLLTLSLSYIHIMHLKAIVSLIFIYTALYYGLFRFSILLYTENFVIIIYTEDEVESYFESSEINYVESS